MNATDSKTGNRDVVVSDEVCSKTGNKLYSLGATRRMVRKLADIPDVRLRA